MIPLTQARRVGKWTKPRRWVGKGWYQWQIAHAGDRYQFVTQHSVGTIYTGCWIGFEFTAEFAHLDGYRGLFMIARKKAAPVAGDVDHLAKLDTTLWKRFPGLVAHCAATRYVDGTPRKVGKIVIETLGESWAVVLNDLDTCKRIRVIASELDAAIQQANVIVQEPEAPWEDAPWLADGGKKKK